MLRRAVTTDRKISFVRYFWILLALLCFVAQPARSEFRIYDTQTYDWVSLGVRKFINTNYIDLNKITQITKS